MVGKIRRESGSILVEYVVGMSLLGLVILMSLPDLKDAIQYRATRAMQTASSTLPCQTGLTSNQCL
ncbi:MAG: hypothetical protein D6808_05135 [Candidatus Dadabacteria bacterium]|nr:MAG: hypothetical protein D6808_05135 [Candidatus Dadabacteria bacterium]